MMPFHKISTLTGATAPVEKVKEISSYVKLPNQKGARICILLLEKVKFLAI